MIVYEVFTDCSLLVNQLQQKTSEDLENFLSLVKFTFRYSKYGFPFTFLFLSYTENFNKALDIVECILPTSSSMLKFLYSW